MRAFFLLLLTWQVTAFAQSKWEVAVIFLGAGEEAEYQLGIDRNILELATSRPNDLYRLSIYRDFTSRAVSYFADPKSSVTQPWDALFHQVPQKGVPIAGKLYIHDDVVGNVLSEDDRLGAFLKEAFRDETAKRMLVIYGHGLAFEGLKNVSLPELQAQLATHLPTRRASKKPLDILWFNSCFMATIEVTYHLRDLATYQMASEAAEFTAGAPFEMLRILDEGPDDVLAVAKTLAENYLESYSVKEKGSQSKDVLITSATIAVVESDRLKMLVDALTWVVNSLKPLSDAEKETLLRSRKRVAIKIENASMMIDLGSFLRYLKDRKDRFASPEAQARLDSILHLLELEKSTKLKTNPRFTLYAPVKNSRLVYGYAEWTRGHKEDLDALALLPNELKFDRFLKGPNAKEWPSRNIVKRLTISPFAPGLNHFDFYFEGSAKRFHKERSKQDFATFEASHAGNPIRFSGYTQERGKLAERYTGLTVLDPAEPDYPPSYSYNDFSKATLWEELLVK